MQISSKVEGGGERQVIVVDNLRSEIERLSGDAGLSRVGKVLRVRLEYRRQAGKNSGNREIGAGTEELRLEIMTESGRRP